MRSSIAINLGLTLALLTAAVVACSDEAATPTQAHLEPTPTGPRHATGGLGQTVAQSGIIEIADACDVLIVPAGDAEGAGPNLVAAAPGTTIRLVGPEVHLCSATDAAGNLMLDETGHLAKGNGIAIEADQVTLDLNGRSIRSVEDVAALGEARNLDVENAGVAVGGANVTVTNTSPTVSVVDNFTANFDFKSTNSRLAGQKVNGVYTLVGGNAHGGGALAIDKSNGLTIDQVRLVDLSENGDNGVDLKKSSNVRITGSEIEGVLTGIRVRFVNDVTIEGNTRICGRTFDSLEIGPETSGLAVNGNTFCEKTPTGCAVAD